MACEDGLVRGQCDQGNTVDLGTTRQGSWPGLTGRAGVQRRLPGSSATPLSLTRNKERVQGLADAELRRGNNKRESLHLLSTTNHPMPTPTPKCGPFYLLQSLLNL